jgi:Tfp pilus assembly protein PilO
VRALSKRERRAIGIWLLALAAFAVIYFWPASSSQGSEPDRSLPQAEKILARLRRRAAGGPGRTESLKKATEELTRREKGLIQAETPAQAQAQLLQILRRIGQAQQPALSFRATEFGAPRAFGNHYGEVTLTVSVECGIEQIVNFLTDVANQPELIATTDLQFSQVTGKQKLVPARMTISAMVPRRLVPEQKGGAAF